MAKSKHSWRYYNTNSDQRYCYECGIQQTMSNYEWVTVWPKFGPAFKRPFCEEEMEPART